MSLRRALPLLLVAVGVLAGLAVALLQPTLYRSEATLVVQRDGRPVTNRPALARQMAALATSDIVVRNVERELSVSVDSDRLHSEEQDGVIQIAYSAESRIEATRVVQQVATDFSRLVASRFGAGGETLAVFDPPHTAGQEPAHAIRDAAVGLLAGLVAGGIAALLLRRPRERAPAPRPAGTSLREDGRWRVSALAELVEAAAPGHPAQIDDWRAYIGVLRGQADERGLLPAAFDGVVREVFAPLLPVESR